MKKRVKLLYFSALCHQNYFSQYNFLFDAAFCKDCIKYEGNTGNGEKKMK